MSCLIFAFIIIFVQSQKKKKKKLYTSSIAVLWLIDWRYPSEFVLDFRLRQTDR